MRKKYVISVRIPTELGEKFDQIAKSLPLNKTDFITECIKKLVDDNEFFMKYYPKIPELIENIKDVIKRLSKEYIKIKNGKIEDINEIAIFSFCDLLFSESKNFWQAGKDIHDKWEIEILSYNINLFKEFTEDFLFDMEDISLLLTPKSTQIPAEDLLDVKDWSDDLENKKLVLLLAAEKTFKTHDPRKIISDIIKEKNRSSKKENFIFIDVKGNFRRGKDTIYNPVYIDTLDSDKNKGFEK